MKAFRSVTSRAAVLDRADVDTDQIIPKQFLKRVERSGFGEFLFFDWRRDPGFELNRPEYADAKILLAGRNFACGSSREHAAWALQDYGYQAIVAPSYGDIFASNAAKVGLVCVTLTPDQVRALMATSASVTVDLGSCVVSGGGLAFPFTFDEFSRHKILNGLDDIALTLQYEDAISAYEVARPSVVDTLAT